MITSLIVALIISIIINVVLFLVAYWFKTDKLTDAAYALSFIILVAYAYASGTSTWPRSLITSLVVVWALRLGGFLLYRIQKTGRDQRFDAWRNSFWLLGRFWVLQAITAWIVLLPVLMALFADTTSLGALSLVGILIWGIGFATETMADWQKFQFNQKPANHGRWISSGLWAYSRHPNYFGEITVWFGAYVACLASLTLPGKLIGLISPVYIASILLFATGIPILEKQADAKWGNNPDYRRYKSSTSVLIPWRRMIR